MSALVKARMTDGVLGPISVEMELHDCAACGFIYACTKAFFDRRRADGASWSIPCGHTALYRESEADKEKKRADQLAAELAHAKNYSELQGNWLRNEREGHKATERKLSAAKGQQTKLKKRIAHGVCPCCNRSFAEVARHMKRQHPEFVFESDGVTTPQPE